MSTARASGLIQASSFPSEYRPPSPILFYSPVTVYPVIPAGHATLKWRRKELFVADRVSFGKQFVVILVVIRKEERLTEKVNFLSSSLSLSSTPMS